MHSRNTFLHPLPLTCCCFHWYATLAEQERAHIPTCTILYQQAKDVSHHDPGRRGHDIGGSLSGPAARPPLPSLRRSLNTIPISYRHHEDSVALITSLHHGILFHDTAKSWCIYQTILHNHPLGSRLISPRLLHALSALLWKTRPITRQTFLRLVSVISELRSLGHAIYTWEWNALIHAAGAGFRRTATKDFEAALNITQEMIAESLKPQTTQRVATRKSRVDIVTVNTLLAIASRTRSKRNVQHALDMLASRSDITPDRITHLILLNYYGRTGRLDRIPGCINRLIQTESGIGVDGINATMWAYARSGRLDYAMRIYEKLRLNLTDPDPNDASISDHKEGDHHPILSLPHIGRALVLILPDSITYTALIQCLAYHGDFTNAISVYKDYVGTKKAWPHLARYFPKHVTELTQKRAYAPSVEIYRSLFIGFTRYGVFRSRHQSVPLAEELQSGGTHSTLFSRHHAAPLSYPPRHPKSPYVTPSSHSAWTLQSLSDLFDNFLEVPSSQVPCINGRFSQSSTPYHQFPSGISRPPVPPQVMYWALVAFSRTTNADKEVMRAAWHRMVRAFHIDCPQTSQLPIPRTTSFGDSFTLRQELIGSGKADTKWRPGGRLKRLVEWVESEERRMLRCNPPCVECGSQHRVLTNQSFEFCKRLEHAHA